MATFCCCLICSGLIGGVADAQLFYILIGLLAAFGLVSFFSLVRARRRRNAIFSEAQRLGVMVPGVPGYVSVRDRQDLTWAKQVGRTEPDWWEVGTPVEKDGYTMHEKETDFHPLSIIPPPQQLSNPAAVPHSELSFFPNHLAYRAETLDPPPSRFTGDPAEVDALTGDRLDVVTIIRMPREPDGGAHEGQEDPEAVVRQWGGIELGVMGVDMDGR